MTDMVNHPPHYGKHPTGVECIAIVEEFNFNIGNAIKYLWRAGLKGDAVEDLEKAKWYVQREIDRKVAPLRAVRSYSTDIHVTENTRSGLSFNPGAPDPAE